MSDWIHVAGIFRIDAIRNAGISTEPDFDKLFGKECLFEELYENYKDLEEHPEDYLPKGREGTLRKLVWDNPDKDHSSSYTVSIFGDLRDVYTDGIIREYLYNLIKKDYWEKNKIWIRQAIVQIDDERCGLTCYNYICTDSLWSGYFAKGNIEYRKED